jgi:hypothetical protein
MSLYVLSINFELAAGEVEGMRRRRSKPRNM